MSEADVHELTEPSIEQNIYWTAPRLIAIGSVTLFFALIAILTAATVLGE